MARKPKFDPIKQRLDDLFSSIPFVAPDVSPGDGRADASAAPRLEASAPQFSLALYSQFTPALEQSFERQAAGMALMDLQGRFLRVNPALCRLLAFTRAEIVGASFQRLVHPLDIHLAIDAMRAMLLSAKPVDAIQLRLQRKDSVPVWVALHLALLPGASRKPTHFSLLALEVSYRQSLAQEPEAEPSELVRLPAPLPGRAPSVPHTVLPEPAFAAARPAVLEAEWSPELPLAALAGLETQPAALVAAQLSDLPKPERLLEPPLAAPIPSEWQPEQSLAPSQALPKQLTPPPAGPECPADQDNHPLDVDLPKPASMPPPQILRAKPASPAARRLVERKPAGEQVARQTAPLAALALPGRAGAGALATPLARLGQVAFPVFLLLYLLGIALAEMVTTFASPQLGLVIHGGLLVLIFLHASVTVNPAEQKLLFTLAMAPLIRLLSLSMPLLEFPFTYWYFVIGAPLFLSVWLVFRLTGYKAAEIGLSLGRDPLLQIGVALTGLVFGYLEYKILNPKPLVESFNLQDIWLPALILLVFTGFLEELIFRGLMQRAALVVMGRLSLLYISLLFAVLHIGYRSLADFVFVLFVGLFFSLVVERTRSLIGVTIAHGLTNISLFLIFPFLPF
jgi:hypothetical protein